MKMENRKVFEQWAEDHYFEPNFTVKPYNGEYYDPVMEHSFEIFSAGWSAKESDQKGVAPVIPDAITINDYDGYAPPEDGNAGQYYVDGWNDCRQNILDNQY